MTAGCDACVARLRAVGLALPEAVEEPMFDYPDWRVPRLGPHAPRQRCAGEPFAFGSGGAEQVGVKVGRDAMPSLVAADPRVSVVPYIGRLARLVP